MFAQKVAWNNNAQTILYDYFCRFGGIMVSVIATEPKGCGFLPSQGDGFLRAIKFAAHLPLGWEVKREGPMS
jgi:hypothetical protein